MSGFKATANKGDGGGFERAPAGTHPAVLVGIIDLGDQWVEPFGGVGVGSDGKERKARWQRQLYYVYELVTKKRAGMSGNHLIAIDLNFSMNEKAKMRKWVEARTGKKIADGTDYDVIEELGKPVLLTVEMRGDYPKIAGVTGVPDGFSVPDPVTPPVAWVMDPSRVDDIPVWVPYLYGEKVVDVVRRSRQVSGERPKSQRQTPAVGGQSATDGDQEIPF